MAVKSYLRRKSYREYARQVRVANERSKRTTDPEVDERPTATLGDARIIGVSVNGCFRTRKH